MAIKLRLTKIGKKNAPAYRIIAIDSRKRRDGAAREILGHYNPSANPPAFSLNKERFDYWKKQGAVVSLAVQKLAEGTYKFTKYAGSKAKKEEVSGKSEVEPKAEPVEAKTETDTDTKDESTSDETSQPEGETITEPEENNETTA